jgi:hypothetical protein
VQEEEAMTLRKLLSQGLPEPPDEVPGPRALVAQVLDLPLLAPIRIFWANLYEMRPWWPVLLPLLAWVGWRTYKRERAAVLAQYTSSSNP